MMEKQDDKRKPGSKEPHVDILIYLHLADRSPVSREEGLDIHTGQML